jgi:hypothetical protein
MFRHKNFHDLNDYLSNQENQNIIILGGGQMRKRGSTLTKWTRRSYHIKADHKLLYYQYKTTIPKGIIDISEAEISLGRMKNIKRSGIKESGDAVSITILAPQNKKQNFDLVFDSETEAKKFCFLIACASVSHNVLVRQLLPQPTFLKVVIGLCREEKLDRC